MKKYLSRLLLIVLLCLTLSPASAQADAILSVPLTPQEHSNWCWAGSADGVLRYYGTTETQCAMANYAWGRSDCCTGSDFYWNHPCDKPNHMYGAAGSLHDILANWGVSSVGVSRHLNQGEVTSQINAGRPFILRYGWTGGGGHFIVGRGIQGNNVYLMDPWPGNGYSIVAYSSAVSSSQHNWTHTLTTSSATPPPPPQYYTVTATAGSGGSVSPISARVSAGSTADFTVTPDSGYSHGPVGGTCPAGSFRGNTYTTGAITADCSVSFTFTQAPTPTDAWKTEIGIVNVTASNFAGTLRGFNNSGTEVYTGNITGGPHSRGSWDVTQLVGAATAAQIKSMRFDITSGMAVGYQKFYQAGKFRVGLEAQPSPNASGLYLPHITSSGAWWTGIGLINASTSQKNMQFLFDNGQQDSLSLAPGAHSVSPITQGRSARVTDGSGTAGLLLFGSTNGRQLSGVTLNDNTSPILIFPHITANAQWWTGYVAYNPNATTATYTAKAFDAAGRLTASATGSIPAYTKLMGSIDFPGNWFYIESSLPLMGFELFGTTNGNQLAGYSVVNLATTFGVFPKIENNGWTTIAFVNIGGGPATITMEARNNSGQVIASTTGALGPGGKSMGAIEEYFPGQSISGATYVRFTSDQGIVAFQLNGSSDGTMLDAIPALGATATLGTSTLYFPHIAAQ